MSKNAGQPSAHRQAGAEQAPGNDLGTVTRSAAVIALGTLLSRVLGAVRDVVIAATFRVGATDAFFVAFTIPNAFRALLAEGAASAAFLPALTRAGDKDSTLGREVFKAIAKRLALLSTLLATMLVALAPFVVTLYAGGYRDAPDKFALTVELSRVVAPYLVLMSLFALGNAALQSRGRFLEGSVAPVLLNLSFIASALLLSDTVTQLGFAQVFSLAIGAIVGGVLQNVFLLPALKKQGWLKRDNSQQKYAPECRTQTRDAFKRLLPLVAGVAVYQANILLSRLFASTLGEGAQSYLYYGFRVVELVQGALAVAVGTALLPALSRRAVRSEWSEFSEVTTRTLSLNVAIAMPASLLFFVLAEPIVSLLFGRGAFSAEHVERTAEVLRALALGVVPIAGVRTLVPACHAQGDIRSPVICSAMNLVVFVAGCLALRGSLGTTGIAVSTSLAALVQVTALGFALAKRRGRPNLRAALTAVLRSLFAGVCSAAGAALVYRLVATAEAEAAYMPVVALLLAALVAAISYVVLLVVLRAPELKLLTEALERRRSR